MFVNAIRNLIYADGVVSFELVFQDPRKKSATFEVTRIDMPYDRLVEVNGILNIELEKIGKVHREWMDRQLKVAAGKKAPAPVKAPKKVPPPAKPERPKAGRLLKKV